MNIDLISVDFISLAIQIKRLEEYLGFIEEIYDKVRYVSRSLENMTLDEIRNELDHALRLLQEAIDEIAIDIKKLKKVYELYEECEDSVFSLVTDLPCNMPPLNKVSLQNQFWRQPPPFNFIHTIKTDVFSGHSVINEDWLDELIFR